MHSEGASYQAQQNSIKNRGTPGLWFEHKADFSNPPPHQRIRPEAKDIADKSKPTISGVMHSYQLKEDEPRPPQRLRDEEAVKVADKFNHQKDKWFDFEGNQQYEKEKPPVKCYWQGQEIAEANNPQRPADWFDHTKKATGEPIKTRLVSQDGRDIAENLKGSHAADWFEHHTSNAADSGSSYKRVTREGAEYMERNRSGTGRDSIMSHTEHDQTSAGGDARPVHCISNEARDNWNNSRGASMRDCFDYAHPGAPERPMSRTRNGEAEENAHRNAGSFTVANNKASSADEMRPGARVRADAEGIYEKSRGQLGQFFDQKNNCNYNSPRPAPRIRSEQAQEAAEKNKGRMDNVLTAPAYASQPPDRKLHPRGAGAGADEAVSDIKSKNSGSQLAALVTNANLHSDTVVHTRVKGDGAANADANRGAVGALFNDYSRAPQTPPAARNRPEAAENAEKYRGSGFSKVMQQQPPSDR